MAYYRFSGSKEEGVVWLKTERHGVPLMAHFAVKVSVQITPQSPFFHGEVEADSYLEAKQLLTESFYRHYDYTVEDSIL
jgi:hypothetical protein